MTLSGAVHRMCSILNAAWYAQMSRTIHSSRLAKSVKNLTTDELAARPRRTESIKLRVTEDQKNEMRDVADELEMTLSEFVVQIIEQALPRLRRGRR